MPCNFKKVINNLNPSHLLLRLIFINKLCEKWGLITKPLKTCTSPSPHVCRLPPPRKIISHLTLESVSSRKVLQRLEVTGADAP